MVPCTPLLLAKQKSMAERDLGFGGMMERKARGSGGCSCSPFTDPFTIYYKTRSWKSRKGNVGRDDKAVGSSMAEKPCPSNTLVGYKSPGGVVQVPAVCPAFSPFIYRKPREIFHPLC